MFTKGKIKSYDAKSDCGVISLQGGNRDVFFYGKDFPNKKIALTLGENLKFLLVEDNGKLHADNIVRLDFMCDLVQAENDSHDLHAITQNPVEELKSSQARLTVLVVIGCLLFIAVSVLGYKQYQSHQAQKQLKVQQLVQEQKAIIAAQRAALGDLPDEVIVKEKRTASETVTPATAVTAIAVANISTPTQMQFSCDGRTHCSQMRSYEEAVFFLRNCPGTKMDGNHDGEPCEKQFGR